jgi:MarR family transcriptional regulator, organic hydroperoxide resistance regulator
VNENEIKNLTSNFFNLLRQLQNKFFRPLELVMKCDISPMQFRTMGIINEKKTITMSELANEVLISKQQLTPMIDKMIDSNIVERTSDKEDRRIIKISLTPYGNELLEDRKSELLKSLSKKFENLDLEDIAKLNIALDTINKIITKLD